MTLRRFPPPWSVEEQPGCFLGLLQSQWRGAGLHRSSDS